MSGIERELANKRNAPLIFQSFMRVLIVCNEPTTAIIPDRFVFPINPSSITTIQQLAGAVGRRFQLSYDRIRLQLIDRTALDHSTPFDLLPSDRVTDVLRENDTLLLSVLLANSSCQPSPITPTEPRVKHISNDVSSVLPSSSGGKTTKLRINTSDHSSSSASDADGSGSSTSDTDSSSESSSGSDTDTSSSDSGDVDSSTSDSSDSDDSDDDGDEPPEEVQTRVERNTPERSQLMASNDQLINVSFRDFRRPVSNDRTSLCGGQSFAASELRYWNELAPVCDQISAADERIRNVSYDWQAVCEFNGMLTTVDNSSNDSNVGNETQHLYNQSMVPQHKRKRLEQKQKQQRKTHKRFADGSGENGKADESIDYTKLVPCKEPIVGQLIAYQQLELDLESFTPKLSDYRQAEILDYNRLRETVSIKLLSLGESTADSSDLLPVSRRDGPRKLMPREIHAAAFAETAAVNDTEDNSTTTLSWSELLNVKLLQ